jgi:HK97 family phage major capsid protein
MPINTVELRHSRKTALDEAREVLDAAMKENRAVTPEERAKYDAAMDKAKNISQEVELAEIRNELEINAELARKSGRAFGKISRVAMPDHIQKERDGFRFVDQFGNEHRALRHDESVRSLIGDTDRDLNPAKFLRAVVLGDWTGADAEHRAYSKGLSVGGGFLLSDGMSADWVDMTRAKSVVSAAGARTVLIPAGVNDLLLARVTSRPTAYWTAEGGNITVSNGEFGNIKLSAKTLAVYCTISLELMRDAPNAQTIIEDTITTALAEGLDAACLNGAGTEPSIAGLLHDDFVTDYAVGGPFTHDKAMIAIRGLYGNNIEPQAVIWDHRVRSFAERLVDGEGLPLAGPPTWANLPKYMSTQLSSTANRSCYVGDFSNCLLGLRSGIEIEISGVADDVFRKKQIAIRGLLRADFGVARAGDVVKMSGITGTT